jgi:hypothetical protein
MSTVSRVPGIGLIGEKNRRSKWEGLTMRRYVLCALTILLCVTCKPDAPTSDVAELTGSKPSTTVNSLGVVEEKKPLTRGDVEQQVWIAAKLVEENLPANVAQEVMQDARERLNMATAEVRPPYPAKLLVNVTVTSKENYNEQPVAVRGVVYLEDQEVGSFHGVVGANAMDQPFGTEVNVLDFVEAKPQSLLLIAKAEAHLLPPETDQSTVDPLTAKAANEEDVALLLSNPLRINFLNEETSP